MKVKPIKQPNKLACGPTCIFMISRYFGGNIDFEKIEKLTQYKKHQGVTDEDIVRVCRQLGYACKRFLNSSWNNLRSLNGKNAVIIVSWMRDGYMGHVSVVDRITKDHIFLADPEVGRIIRLKKVQFMRLWVEYDGLWWPRISEDIRLRPLILVKNV